MNHIWSLGKQVPQHTNGQTQGQKQGWGFVEWQTEAKNCNNLQHQCKIRSAHMIIAAGAIMQKQRSA